MRLTKALLDAIVAYETPAGWVVVQSRRPAERDLSSGQADALTNVIRTPPIANLRGLLIFLHECGHVRLNHFKGNHVLFHVEEYEAWNFAIKHARMYGIALSRSVIGEMRRRVRDSVEADEKNGRPIRRHIRTWAGRR